MKLAHNWNGYAPDRGNPEWAERIEREAEAVTAAAEARSRRTAERLARAEARAAAAAGRHEAALSRGATKRELDRLAKITEARRRELLAIHAEMARTPAGSQHRGRGSHRGTSMGEIL